MKIRSKNNKRTMLPTQEDSNQNATTMSKRKLKPASMRSSASTNQNKKGGTAPGGFKNGGGAKDDELDTLEENFFDELDKE
jgi:hypothetical protein